MSRQLTPQEIVEKLDRYIIGQQEAKKSVAVAIRNRFRRQNLSERLKEEVVPKNILMIGPTGVGKTEVARRLAKLINAPFVKVEATKFTEVGYVGRNVESMIKDLVAESIKLVEEEKFAEVSETAKKHAEERLVDLLVPGNKKSSQNKQNPFEMLFGQNESGEEQQSSDKQEQEEKTLREKRREVRDKLDKGLMEEVYVELEIEEQTASPGGDNMGPEFEEMGINFQDLFSQFMPNKTKQKRMPVREARKVLERQEAQKLVNEEQVQEEAVDRAENYGIIFLDEFDKIAVNKDQQSGPDVSREGVQRDILPIVEGSTVSTKYGRVSTDHIMFIGAGAFHDTKPSDLIPELQGRFPIRVTLESLTTDDFYRILTEPQNALLDQYQALLETEQVQINFTDEAIQEIAHMAEQVNTNTEDIGARRLHTLLEQLLEDLSFHAPEMRGQQLDIKSDYVKERLSDIVEEEDISRFIL